MDNTELIKRLKKFTESYKYDLDLTDEEAEQIIQALEGVDKLDKIIDEVSEMNPYKQAGNEDSYSRYNEGWTDACDILGQRIVESLKPPTS